MEYLCLINRTTKPTRWHRRPAKTRLSLCIHPVWSESSLCAEWVAKDRRCFHTDNEDSDQTGWMTRLTWVLAGRTCHFVGFVMRGLIYLWLLRRVALVMDQHLGMSQYKWSALRQNSQNDCAPSEDSDPPGHPSSLIRVFAVRMKKVWVLSYLPIERTAKTLIRLGGCPCWSESSLGAHSLCWFFVM